MNIRPVTRILELLPRLLPALRARHGGIAVGLNFLSKMHHVSTSDKISCLPLLMILYLGSTASAIGADADALLSKTTSVRSAPGSAQGKLMGRLLIGESVKIQKIAGDSMLVQSAKYAGWVPVEQVVRMQSFRPLREWRGPKTIAVGDGDYDATYTFASDGTFSVTESEPTTNKMYRTISRTGRLHSSGNFVWAKRSDAPFYSSQIFVRTENGKLCWQRYMDGRCGVSP